MPCHGTLEGYGPLSWKTEGKETLETRQEVKAERLVDLCREDLFQDGLVQVAT